MRKIAQLTFFKLKSLTVQSSSGTSEVVVTVMFSKCLVPEPQYCSHFTWKEKAVMCPYATCMLLQAVVVCVCTHSSLFVTTCQHDQGLHVLLPYHPPELAECDWQRTLSCNILLPGVVTLPNQTITTEQKQPPRSVSSEIRCRRRWKSLNSVWHEATELSSYVVRQDVH